MPDPVYPGQTEINYRVEIPEPYTHLVDVTMEVDDLSGGYVDFQMPVWTPGSYRVRDFPKSVQEFAAFAPASNGQPAGQPGRPLAFRKEDKATWRVFLDGSQACTLRYRVYANELSVRTSHVDDTHAFLNGTSVFLYAKGRKDRAATVRLKLPAGWRVATGLDVVPGSTPTGAEPKPGEEHVYWAPDYDILVDCPIEAGTFEYLTFEVAGIEHRVAMVGPGNYDVPALLADMKTIVAKEAEMFGELPYRHYTFIVHLLDAGVYGGLEHLNSTALQIDRFTFQPRKSYEKWLGLVAHEFFHLWNVKRIRPSVFGSFDYTRENYTRLLWAMEGLTSYYDNLFLRWAGLVSAERYLGMLAEDITDVQRTPGRKVQSLEESSLDAWIRLYQPNEHSVNSTISYYKKGALVGLILDLSIRHWTEGEKELADVFRNLYETHAKKGEGITPAMFQAAVEAISGQGTDEFFAEFVRGTRELDYSACLAHVGLRLQEQSPEGNKGTGRAYLGIEVSDDDDGVYWKVRYVLDGTPAWKAGINANDQILAIDGIRAKGDRIEQIIDMHKPGDVLAVTVFRGDRLRTVPVTVGSPQFPDYKIERLPQADERQRRLYEKWLREPW